MRQVLSESIVGKVPDHLGLAYDAWAPTKESDGKVIDENRNPWIEMLANMSVSPDYARSFERWKQSFSSVGDRLAELKLSSRLLIGHGNSSATGVGLTVHHTWGVPVIPGSALKGLLAHYIDATYGPTDASIAQWELQGDELTRAKYQGVTRNGRRIERGPGTYYRALFGATDARDDDVMREHDIEAGATIGLVTFHDALYVPNSIADNKPFAADVLTVHQKEYYNSLGQRAPNDYDSPNPVAFLTVRPDASLLFVLSGPEEWTELAEKLLHDALANWGVGGKTSAGYGRVETAGERRPGDAASFAAATPKVERMELLKVGARVDVMLLEERTKKGGWKARHAGAGLEGPVQNSNEMPVDKKPGDRLSVEVRVAKGKESAFRYLGDVDAEVAKEKK